MMGRGLGLALVAICVSVTGIRAQSGPDTVAVFRAASSLSMGPAGTIWVADPGAGHVVRISEDGLRTKAGLPGGRLSSIDASGGLRLLVADEIEGTVDVRGLSGDLLTRLRLPASAEDAFTSTPEYLDGNAFAATRPSGRAGDVVQMLSGAVAAVESSQGFLVLWDESGRAHRTVSEVAGTPLNLRHLAKAGSGIAATDPDRNRVLFFDAFGTLAGQQQLPSAPLSIAGSGQEVWVATRDHLICLRAPTPNRAKRPQRAKEQDSGDQCANGPAILDSPAASAIVDLAIAPEAFYLLTPRALLRWPRESGGQ